jgi:peptidyl-prolyl cis-trans isomerase B (cyclophilin B)
LWYKAATQPVLAQVVQIQRIDCELTGENQYHDRGVLSMAHAGRNTGSSQFFICHSRDNTAHLDRNHTVFGKVVENVEVVDDIRQGDKILGP